MATRADIRDAFYNELVAAAEGTHTVTFDDGATTTVEVTADNISLISPEHIEQTPAVIYDDNYRRVSYNDVGSGPDMTVYNNDVTVDYVEWRKYIEAQFIIDVRTANDINKEPIYESIRSEFQKYEFPPWPVTDLHADVTNIDVRDARSLDVSDEEDVSRVDQIEVYVTFYRDFEYDIDNVTQVNRTTDGTSSTTN